MKLAALATSFVIGFIAGISFLPVNNQVLPNSDVPRFEYENQRRFEGD